MSVSLLSCVGAEESARLSFHKVQLWKHCGESEQDVQPVGRFSVN